VSFSVVRGGPFCWLLRLLRLARGDGRDAWRQTLALVTIAWAPLVTLAIVQSLATHKRNMLLRDPAVHAHLLLSVPLLVLAEQVMHERSERCIARFVQSGLVSGGAAAIQRVVARGTTLRDAVLPEAALAIAALGAGQASLWGLTSPFALGSLVGLAAMSSAARLWWAIVALPLAQFLLYRSLWRWAIWSAVLWGLASLDVRPVALHPDRRGGLSFLGEPTLGVAIIVMSVDCSVAGGWGRQMIFDHLPLKSWALPFSEIAVSSFIVALGPLCVFSRCMWRARFAAIRQYDMFALTYARLFHQKWVDLGDTENLLGSPDIQSMADLANTLAIVRGMRLVPFGLYEIIVLLAAIWLPILPLFLATVPFHELLRRVLGAFVGAALG
jgi:hypothetical protein